MKYRETKGVLRTRMAAAKSLGCDRCVFFYENEPGCPEAVGECRYNAPRLVDGSPKPDMMYEPQDDWPPVDRNAWCGKWVNRS